MRMQHARPPPSPCGAHRSSVLPNLPKSSSLLGFHLLGSRIAKPSPANGTKPGGRRRGGRGPSEGRRAGARQRAGGDWRRAAKMHAGSRVPCWAADQATFAPLSMPQPRIERLGGCLGMPAARSAAPLSPIPPASAARSPLLLVILPNTLAESPYAAKEGAAPVARAATPASIPRAARRGCRSAYGGRICQCLCLDGTRCCANRHSLRLLQSASATGPGVAPAAPLPRPPLTISASALVLAALQTTTRGTLRRATWALPTVLTLCFCRRAIFAAAYGLKVPARVPESGDRGRWAPSFPDLLVRSARLPQQAPRQPGAPDPRGRMSRRGFVYSRKS